MDALLDYLIPALVFIVYIASQFFGNKKKGDGDGTESPPPSDAEERARRIQEEIRRKIAERRRQQEGHEEDAAEQPPPLQTAPSPYSTPSLGKSRELKPAPQETSFPPPQTSSTEPAFFEIPQPQRNIEAELEEQRKRMEESERRAEAARMEAKTQVDKLQSRVRPYKTRRVTTNLRDDVIATLMDPDAARKAILYYEILGTPVGLRENGQTKPAWTG